MNRLRSATALLLAASACVALPANAIPPPDSLLAEGCVTHGEFDNMERYLSVQQVAGRFDTNGVYLGSGDERFRRGYDACWTNERRVVVWFSLTTGLSDDWATREY